ncbi:pentapeptide repeat-containing protein [Streptomyces boluensis]|uniref:Pentapeptide repeat-containing protein n=1 Tax=Streptomyces boluensis TaxID=1775135 RepID=A0A964UT06_9ACTN|nr:pentapeptide repeat-containing protein [Streptomyces boluensis]NBE54888.1 hypothetical protein [Streptomyces boluensis]
MTDRYVQAIKLLASDKRHERLGGIYSLERIMNDSEKDHDTVVEVLSAFIRTQIEKKQKASTVTLPGNRTPSFIPGPVTERVEVTPWAEDMKAACNVLARSPIRERSHAADLSRVDMAQLDLGHLALTRANLQRVNLERACLSGSNLAGADLQGARLEFAHLEGSNLRGAYLVGADLMSARMTNANLAGAYLDEANLVDAYLAGANLQDSDLSVDQVVEAEIYTSTNLPTALSDDERIKARITQCEAARAGDGESRRG